MSINMEEKNTEKEPLISILQALCAKNPTQFTGTLHACGT